jgi:APA family basic amino acid/polyamine antiporter
VTAAQPSPGRLSRRLGVFDSVVIGLGSMLGAGVFAAFAPAARAAGSGLLIGLAIAAVIAYCNATSSARLAAVYPESGGTYVYGRRRLGEFWGYLAGWCFVVGKTASCTAMALTVGAYLAPQHAGVVAVLTVVCLTAVNYVGVQKSAWLTVAIVAVTLSTLTVVIVASLAGGQASTSHLSPWPGGNAHDILQAAGLLFFAFAGYARIATLGEEVRDPHRTIPRAIPIALTITLVVYAAVAVSTLLAVGAPRLADSSSPLRTAVLAGDLDRLAPVVQAGGAVAAIGALLAMILGVSRTTFAMARDGYLPRSLAAVHSRFGIPHKAELAVSAVVVGLVCTVDLRGAIGFSSFGVLVYYAIANVSAATLSAEQNRPPRWLPVLGLIGCVVLALSLPATSVLSGAAVVAVGVVAYRIRRVSARPAA